MKYLLLLLILTLFNSYPIASQENIWPQFRGINSSGIAHHESNPPESFGLNESLIWKTDLMPGFSSPCIWDNHIFLTGLDADSQTFFIYALERKSGEIIWKRAVEVEKLERVHAVSSPANATPATDGLRVYVYIPSFGLLCFDYEGSEIWSVPIEMPLARFGMGTSPVVSGEMVYLHLAGDEQNPRFMAFNKTDGSIAWKKKFNKAQAGGYSTPVIQDDYSYIFRAAEIGCYNKITGDPVWTFANNTGGHSTPVLMNKVLYVGTHASHGVGDPVARQDFPDFDELCAKYDLDKDSLVSFKEFPEDMKLLQRPEVSEEFGGFFVFKTAWAYMDRDKNDKLTSKEWQPMLDMMEKMYTEHGLVAIELGGKGDVSLTHQLWKESEGVPEVPSPLACHDRIYMVKNGGIITCRDAATGEMIYQERLGAPGPYFSSPIIAGGKLYACSRNGVVSVVRLGDEYKLLTQTDLDANINASPAVVDNVLYIRTDETLYAFGRAGN